MTSPAVIRAGGADLDVLSQVITDAFFDLGPSRWLIACPGARRRVFPGYFRLSVEQALASGIVHTNAGRTAAALWLPGGPDVPALPDGHAERLAAETNPWTSRFPRLRPDARPASPDRDTSPSPGHPGCSS
jgi:hypothetical protein